MIPSFEWNLPRPAENLALDEALLVAAESGQTGECLRFWESDIFFVVLGSTCSLGKDVFQTRCRKDSIRILRRNSGGGTVLQGPGCLNYSLILPYKNNPDLLHIRKSYHTIFGPIVNRLAAKGIQASIEPISDLAWNNRKFSGNAQARKKNFLLHHGTLLYRFDFSRAPLYLRHPPKEPAYRSKRSHENFLINLPLTRYELIAEIESAFETVKTEAPYEVRDMLPDLLKNKYENAEWIERF